MVLLKGWRYAAFVSSLVAFTGFALFPIVIQPMIDPDYYSTIII